MGEGERGYEPVGMGEKVIFPDDPRIIDRVIGEVAGRMEKKLRGLTAEAKREFVERMYEGDLLFWRQCVEDFEMDKMQLMKVGVKRVLCGAFCQEKVLGEVQEQVKAVGGGKLREFVRSAGSSFLNVYMFEVDGRNSYVVPEYVLNPAVAYYLEGELGGQIEYDGKRSRDDRIILAKTMGYFSDEWEEGRKNRAKVTPFIYEWYPYGVRKLKLAPEEMVGLTDSRRLGKLKNFWGEVFTTYWAALSQSENRAAVELSEQERAEAKAVLPPNPHDMMPKDEAEALAAASYWQMRGKLHREIEELVSEYAGKHVPFERVQALFPRGTARLVFGVLAENGKKIEEAAGKLIGVVEKTGDPEEVFGEQFRSLAPVEQVALLGYCAFVANGSLVKGAEGAVRTLSREVGPRLMRHHDLDPKEGQRPGQKKEPEFDLEKYAQIARRARETIERMNPVEEMSGMWEKDFAEELEIRAAIVKPLLEIELGGKRLGEARRLEGRVRAVQEWANYVLVGSGGMAMFAAGLGEVLGVDNPANVAVFGTGLLAFLAGMVNSEDRSQRDRKSAARWQLSVFWEWEYLAGVVEEHMKTIRLDSAKRAKVTAWVSALALAGYMVAPWMYEGAEKMAEYWGMGEGGAGSLGLSGEVAPVVGNTPEALLPGEPGFQFWDNPAEPNPKFWVDKMCVAHKGQAMLGCSQWRGNEIVGGQVLGSQQELQTEIKKLADEGYVVRVNLGEQKGYEIPWGYRPVKLLGVGVGDLSASYGMDSGMRVEKEGGGTVAVVYEPVGKGVAAEETNVVFLPIAGDQYDYAVSPDLFERLGNENLRAIAGWTAAEYANKYQTGMTNAEILAEIKAWIGKRGVEYGNAYFDASLAQSPDGIMAELFAQDPDGGLKNKKWICNQFAFATYAIARSAGMNVYLATGYQQPVEGSLGGWASDAHMIVMYEDEEGLLQPFEATLPGDEFREGYPAAPDYFTIRNQEEQQRRTMLMSLAAAGGVLATGGALASEKFRQRVFKKRRYGFDEVVEKSDNRTVSAVYQGLRWLSENYDVPEVNDALGSREEYARQVGRDMISLATEGELAGVPDPREFFKRQLRADYKAVGEGSLDWLDTAEKRQRLKEGGRQALEYLRWVRRSEGKHMLEERREKVENLYRMFSTIIKNAK